MNKGLKRIALGLFIMAALIDAFMTMIAVQTLMHANSLFVGLGALALALVVNGTIFLTRPIMHTTNVNFKLFTTPAWSLALIIDAGTNYITMSNEVMSQQSDPLTLLLVVLTSLALVGAPVVVSMGFEWFMSE